jgi:LysM repeat protein
MTGTARTPLFGDSAPACAVACLACLLLSTFAPTAHAEPPAAPVTHVVRPGETLYSLAKRYGVPLDRLQAANGLAAPDRVRAGASLRIPDAATVRAGQGDGSPRRTARAGKRPEKSAAAKGMAGNWNIPDQKAAIMGEPPRPDPPKNGSLLDIPLKGGGTLSPEHRDAGAVIMSGAADKKEDFQGHALGLRTTLPAGKDTQVVTTLGYGVNASIKEDAASRAGYRADTSIGGLGYGLGLRHSF